LLLFPHGDHMVTRVPMRLCAFRLPTWVEKQANSHTSTCHLPELERIWV